MALRECFATADRMCLLGLSTAEVTMVVLTSLDKIALLELHAGAAVDPSRMG